MLPVLRIRFDRRVKHLSHNPKVAGSNPAPATKFQAFWDRVVTDL